MIATKLEAKNNKDEVVLFATVSAKSRAISIVKTLKMLAKI